MEIDWTLQTLFDALGISPPENIPHVKISNVQANPAHCSTGSLFIPNEFSREFLGYKDEISALKKAIQCGATAAITYQHKLPFRSPIPVVRVKESVDVFPLLARYARRKFKGKIVAVTGSVGKTSTKDLISNGLSNFGSTFETSASFNSMAPVCATMIHAPPDTDYLTLETASGRPGEIKRYVGHIQPDVGIVTNVWASPHLENYENKEALFREKVSLFDSLVENGIGILHESVADANQQAGSVISTKKLDRLITVGNSPENDIYHENTHFDGIKSTGVMRVFGTPYPYELGLAGAHFVNSAMFAVAAAVSLGLDISTMVASFVKPEITGNRLERYRIKVKGGDIEFIDDSFNASPVSVRALLNILSLRKAPRKIFIWGDITGLGERSDYYHSQLASMIDPKNIDVVLTIGDQTKKACQGLSSLRKMHFTDRQSLASALPRLLQSGDLVAMKGSFRLQLPAVAERIKMLGSSHPAGAWRIEDTLQIANKGD